MNELQPIETTDSSLPAKLDVASRALAEATDDWQRIDIRDYAKAIEAALLFSSERVFRCRLLTWCTQSGQLQRRIRQKAEVKGTPKINCGIQNPTVLKKNLFHLLQSVTSAKPTTTSDDDEFEQAKEQAIETETPLTRSYLKEQSAEKKEHDAHLWQATQ